jgi:hypothetical protein
LPRTPRHLAGDGIAHAHRQRRRRLFALLHHVKVVVEGRHLEHLGHRELHRLGERGEARGREAAVAVLHAVQVFDQQVAPARIGAEQRPYLRACRGIDAAALGLAAR